MHKRRIKILIAVLIVLNIAGLAVLFMTHRNNAEKRISEVQSETAAEEVTADALQGTAEEAEDAADAEIRSMPVAAVVDYQTESSERMVRYLNNAGYDSVLLTSIDDLNVDDYDVLVIPGGHNVTPSIYGAERDEHTTGTDLDLDHMQIDAVNLFKDAGKPVLGICRGAQLVNAALGGTINQHIPGWHKKLRDVKISEQSFLYELLGDTENVWHFHHQCVEELAPGLYATQWDAEDGRIEAYEHESLPIYGIQWHPDASEMGDRGEEVFRYFKDKIVVENMKEHARSGDTGGSE